MTRGVTATEFGSASDTPDLDGLVVADLSSLWAGPTVGRILAAAGATVIKVESISRPDGGRSGDPQFFDRLNGGKASVGLDFRSRRGRWILHQIVGRADVVITSCRHRALDQLDLEPSTLLRTGRPRAWVMISGYGDEGDGRDRVAFGDDAAAAGGLVMWDNGHPLFCGDAIADSLTGLAATATLLASLGRGGSWLISASMADVAADMQGTATIPAPSHAAPGPSGADPLGGVRVAPSPPLGSDTWSVMDALGIP